LIKRSSLKFINNLLEKNKNWKVLDIGCGYTANKHATTLCDVINLQNYYPDKKFVKLDTKNLPFIDKEFDFVIASHVLEHINDINFFINELQRISKKGYIEVPTTLEDNLVFENKKDHLWHINFDDDNYKLIINKKVQVFEPILTVSTSQKLREYFRDSLVTELYWEEKIDFKFKNESNLKPNSVSILNLFKKFISKKIRNLFR
tara:strand:- start:11730 stop:12341 length:612 start_codon:yes stop_codon:yes gene_type:complete